MGGLARPFAPLARRECGRRLQHSPVRLPRPRLNISEHSIRLHSRRRIRVTFQRRSNPRGNKSAAQTGPSALRAGRRQAPMQLRGDVLARPAIPGAQGERRRLWNAARARWVRAARRIPAAPSGRCPPPPRAPHPRSRPADVQNSNRCMQHNRVRATSARRATGSLDLEIPEKREKHATPSGISLTTSPAWQFRRRPHAGEGGPDRRILVTNSCFRTE